MPSNTPTIPDRTVFIGDNLDVMRGLPTDSVDLIYLDPPFNSNRNYEAPIGSKAAGAAFKDTWSLSDVDLAWHGQIADENPGLYEVIRCSQITHGDGMMSYLVMMGVRLLEMKRLLKPSGSIYLHCDPTASHYLKLVMDSVFGKKNFRNEIIWRIGWVSGFKTQKRGWIRNHDTILYYASPEAAKKFNKEYLPYPDGYVRRDGKRPTGKGIPLEDTWNCSAGDRLDSIMIKSFSKEKMGYPTQKPLQLLDRIIKASSNEGDVVLDPFAGCATACVAAERLNRKWIGIDLSDKAGDMIRLRLEKDEPLASSKVDIRTDLPIRTDLEDDPRTDQQVKEALYGSQQGNCNGCQQHFPYRNFEVDHIIPRAKNGADHPSNKQLLCGACNRVKGTGTQAALIAKLTADKILR